MNDKGYKVVVVREVRVFVIVRVTAPCTGLVIDTKHYDEIAVFLFIVSLQWL
jgi:hypothetical protein